MKAMRGQRVEECAYVASHLTSLPFFASKVRLGPHGVQDIPPLPPMTSFEEAAFQAMQKELKGSIDKGIEFANQ